MSVSIDSVHYSVYPDPLVTNVDLQGYYTASIWANFTNSCDRLYAVSSCSSDTIFGDCSTDNDSQNASLVFSDIVFQHDFGAISGDELNCNLLSSYPSLQFDSYITIGLDCTSNNQSIFTLDDFCMPDPWQTFNGDPLNADYFDGADLLIDDGYWALQPSNGAAGIAGNDLKVKIAQITTNGSFCFNGCVGYFFCNDENDSLYFENVSICQDPPCPNFGIENFSLVPASCPDEVHQAEITVQGTQPFDYVLLDNGDLSNSFNDQTSPFTIDIDSSGNYSIVVTDDLGCRDTTINFLLPEIPLPFQFSMEVIDSTDCFGDSTGSVVVHAEGGTDELFILVNDEILVINHDTLSNVLCGEYFFTVTDVLGCEGGPFEFILPCYAPITLNYIESDASCSDLCDGSIFVEIISENSEVSLFFEGIEISNGASPFTYELPELCIGEYQIEAVNNSNCTASEMVSIESAPPISLITEVNPETCPGYNDAHISGMISGGNGPYVVVMDPDAGTIEQTGDSFTIQGIPAGAYILSVYDNQGCTGLFDLPVDILFDDSLWTYISIIPESCYGTSDASAQVDVVNGISPYEYYWPHDPSNENNFSNSLSAPGPYLLEITDGNGCVFPISITIPLNTDCLIIPTAITPNGDGANDFWFVDGLEQFPLSEAIIFNCWGQILYSEKQGIPHWNGMYKNEPLPIADYYYIIDLHNGTDPMTGTVTIKY